MNQNAQELKIMEGNGECHDGSTFLSPASFLPATISHPGPEASREASTGLDAWAGCLHPRNQGGRKEKSGGSAEPGP